jgi:hypothetical protein
MDFDIYIYMYTQEYIYIYTVYIYIYVSIVQYFVCYAITVLIIAVCNDDTTCHRYAHCNHSFKVDSL